MTRAQLREVVSIHQPIAQTTLNQMRDLFSMNLVMH